MKLKRLKKFSLIICTLVILALVILPVSNAFAINPPDTLTLDSINAYQSVIETNDQLFLAKFTIAYSTYPTDATANDAFLFRMFDSTAVEINSIALYANPYFNDGFGQGVVAIYFTADECASLGLTWTEVHSFYIASNPTLSTWNGTATTPATAVTTWSTTSSAITTRVAYLAGILQSAWGVNLIDSGTLTIYGQNYFISTIPYIRSMAPTLFTSYVLPAEEYRERTFTLTYAATLRNQWIGTWLDLTDVGTDWGIDPMWIYGLIWLVAMIGIGYITITVGAAQQNIPTYSDNKPLFYVEMFVIFFGGLLGFLPWLAAVLTGVIMILIILNQVLFSKANV